MVAEGDLDASCHASTICFLAGISRQGKRRDFSRLLPFQACRYSTAFGRLLWEPVWVPDVTTVLRGHYPNY
jgi:hypothetical protein